MEANTKSAVNQPLASEAATSTPIQWEQCTVIRPRAESASAAKVEISNGLLEKRVALSRRALMELVGGDLYDAGGAASRIRGRLDAIGITRASADRNTIEGIAHWRKRHWTYSLPYYLWSRRIAVADAGQNAAKEQRRIIGQYMSGNEPEPQHRVAAPANRLSLPEPTALPDEPLAHVFLRRHASFTLPERSMASATLSGILWYGLQSVRTARRADPAADPGLYLRSFGSALDFYVVAYAIDGLEPGVYLYDVADHVLQPVHHQELRRPMQIALNGQQPPMTAACTLIMCAEFQRYQWRYRHERALRQLYVDTARIAQYAILVATSYRKYVHMSPAVNDAVILSMIRRNPAEDQVLYTLSIS